MHVTKIMTLSIKGMQNYLAMQMFDAILFLHPTLAPP